MTSGFLVVVIPDKDTDTNLEFKYWIGGYTEIPWTEMVFTWNFDSENGPTVYALLMVVLTMILCCCSCCFCCCISRCFREKPPIEIIDEDFPIGTDESPRPHYKNENSMIGIDDGYLENQVNQTNNTTHQKGTYYSSEKTVERPFIQNYSTTQHYPSQT